MNARILAIVLFTLLAESCRSLSPGPPATIEPRITITVVNSKDTSVLLPGIDVVVVTGNGHLLPIGQTDFAGTIGLSKSMLRERSASMILFCHRHFFCGALLVNENKLMEFDEYVIAVSPIIVH